MKRRIATWASAGLLVACCWVLLTFLVPPDSLGSLLRQPALRALALASCPISLAGRYFALSFWWVLAANAATYAVAGLVVESARRQPFPKFSD